MNEFLEVKMQLKSVSESDGTFTGYAGVFGNIDSYGDILVKGCFADSIAESKGKVPILANHDS